MDESGHEMETAVSESFQLLLNKNSVEEIYAMIKDLDKKISTEKEFKELTSSTIDETQVELQALRHQQESNEVQVTETRKRITLAQEELGITKAEKVAAELAERQRSEQKKVSGMTKEQKMELRDNLAVQRSQINNLEDKIEELEHRKTVHQKTYSEYRVALKERKHAWEMLIKDHEEAAERRKYLISTAKNLESSIQTLREDIKRLKTKQADPVKNEVNSGKTLFDEVTAEKKSLETELVDLIEFTNALRHQIRQKQDEIDELESSEMEVMGNIDTEYVLMKMRELVREGNTICEVIKTLEDSVYSSVDQIEQALKDVGENRSSVSSVQYTNLRDYHLDCVKVVGRECKEAMTRLRELFNELEQLAVEYMGMQERLTHTKQSQQ